MTTTFEHAFRELPYYCGSDPLAMKTVADCWWCARTELDLHESGEDGCCSKRQANYLRAYLKKWGGDDLEKFNPLTNGETTMTTKTKKAAKEPKAKKTKPEPKDKKLSAINAAAKVLAESNEPMSCQAMIDRMAEKKYWTSPGGKTPSQTLYSSILREIKLKGKEARFKKTDRGTFAAN